MAQSKGAIFYPEHVAVARGLLNDAEIGQLFLAVSDYADSGELPDPPSKAWGVCFDLMRSAIDKNAKRYEETCARNREKANKRWNNQSRDAIACSGIQRDAVACTGMQTHADDANQIEQNRTEPNQAGKNYSRRAKRFTPPTVEEVKTYCAEIGSGIDAERFVDYYTTNGWKAGKNPMIDWKAAVRTWTKREGSYREHDASPAPRNGLHAIPTAEEYEAGVDPSGFGWA